MNRRHLRILWSIAWIAVFLLLSALWIASYRVPRVLLDFKTVTHHYFVFSSSGVMSLERSVRFLLGFEVNYDAFGGRETELENAIARGLVYISTGTACAVSFAYWLLVPAALLIACAPWCRLHFSLRALLVAMTAVAAALGVIVYQMH